VHLLVNELCNLTIFWRKALLLLSVQKSAC